MTDVLIPGPWPLKALLGRRKGIIAEMVAKLALIGFALLQVIHAQIDCEGEEFDGVFTEFPFNKINGTIAANRNCLIGVRLPANNYANVFLTVKNKTSGETVKISVLKDVINVGSEESYEISTALYTDGNKNKISITITTGETTQLYVSLLILAVPLDINNTQKKISTIAPGEQAAVVDFSFLTGNVTYIYNSSVLNNTLTLANLRYDSQQEDNKLTGFFVYDGDVNNPTFQGSLFQFVSKPFVSNSSVVMIYAAMSQSSPSRLIVNVNQNFAGYSNVQYLYGYTNNFSGYRQAPSISVDPSNGPVALIIGVSSDPNYYEDLFLRQNSFLSNPDLQVKVYAGTTPSDSTLLATYDSTNADSSLPQQFPGLIKTFVVSTKVIRNETSTVSTTTFSSSSSSYIYLYFSIGPESAWNTLRLSRTGFFMNRNYPFVDPTAPLIENLTLNADSNQTLYFFESTIFGDNTTILSGAGVASNFALQLKKSSTNSIGALVKFAIVEPPPTTTTLSTTTATTTQTPVAPSNSSSNVTDIITSTLATTTPEHIYEIDECNNTSFELTDDSDIYAHWFSLTSDTSCSYTFTIPEGYVANIRLNAKSFSENETLTISNGFGETRELFNGFLDLSVTWPINGTLNLTIVTGDNTTNEVSLIILSERVNLTDYKVGPSLVNATQALILNERTSFPPGQPVVITSSSKVHISVAYAPQAVAIDESSSILIYDGEGDTADLKGTVHSLIRSYQPYVSSTNSVTLYNANKDGIALNPTRLIFNNYDDVSNFSRITTYWHVAPGVVYAIDATQGPSAITFADGPEFHKAFNILGVDFLGNYTQTLSVYAGALGPNMTPNLLTSFSGSSDSTTYANRLPQDLPGYTKTFILDSGAAYILVGASSDNYTWTINSSNNRTGLIMTPNYLDSNGFNSTYHVIFKENGTNTYGFEISVIKADPTCSLSYSLQNSEGSWINNKPTNLTRQTFTGRSLELFLTPGNNTSTGALLSFNIYKVTTKSAMPLSVSLLLLLSAFYFY